MQNRGKIKIIHKGIVYNSMREVGEVVGYSRAYIWQMLNGVRPNKIGVEYHNDIKDPSQMNIKELPFKK